MTATVRDNGMAERLGGFCPVELGMRDFQTDHDVPERRLTAAGKEAVEEDFAGALILECTLEIGSHHRLAQALGVPVIDLSIGATQRAEYTADLKSKCGWTPSHRWSCEAPPEAEIAAFGIIGDRDVPGKPGRRRRAVAGASN